MRSSWRIATAAVVACGLVGVTAPAAALASTPAASPPALTVPGELTMQGECFVDRCAPAESRAAFEDLAAYIVTIPDDVLVQGDAATNDYVRANPRGGDPGGDPRLASAPEGQPDPLRCAAAVGTILVSVLVPAAKLLKIKQLIKDLGGVVDSVRLLVGAGTAAEKTEALSIALGSLIGELTGIAGVRDTCFA